MDVQPLLPGTDALSCEQVSIEPGRVVLIVRSVQTAPRCPPVCPSWRPIRPAQRVSLSVQQAVKRLFNALAYELIDVATHLSLINLECPLEPGRIFRNIFHGSSPVNGLCEQQHHPRGGLLFQCAHNSGRYLESWRQDYNQQRPHSSLDNPAPAVFAARHWPTVPAVPTPPAHVHDPEASSLASGVD